METKSLHRARPGSPAWREVRRQALARLAGPCSRPTTAKCQRTEGTRERITRTFWLDLLPAGFRLRQRLRRTGRCALVTDRVGYAPRAQHRQRPKSLRHNCSIYSLESPQGLNVLRGHNDPRYLDYHGSVFIQGKNQEKFLKARGGQEGHKVRDEGARRPGGMPGVRVVRDFQGECGPVWVELCKSQDCPLLPAANQQY